ncbi:MAG: hypothetical protein ACXQS6_00425 [Candidatus Syntropharchaeales archaeon]
MSLWSGNASLALKEDAQKDDTMRSIVAVPVNFRVMVERGRCGWSLIVQGI